jgi:hypothetical protein
VATGFPSASVTRTAGGTVTAVPAVALCPVPAAIATVVGPATATFALNVCGDTVSPGAAACTVSVPRSDGVTITLASPRASVTVVVADRVATPPVTVHVTVSP